MIFGQKNRQQQNSGKTFEIKQFHFHAPSEHQINGKSFPFEMHLVHKDTNGDIAVVTVLFVEGKAHDALAQFWPQMPVQADAKKTLEQQVDASALLPRSQDYYQLNGSLTTPPCTEGVRWIVLKEPVTVSSQQVDAFARIMQHPNNRPVQPVNARPVLE